MRKRRAFPIVAIGASAGGLKAFAELLNALPAEPGMAFVLVPHLSPLHKSHLPEILARGAKIPVAEAKEKDRIEPNRVYVIPPNRAMHVKDGVLRVSASGRKLDWRNPIDGFFRSMAADHGKRTIGVLLSGEGSDGTDGMRAIKEGGGATYAQDERTAAHRAMPRSAAAAGFADQILSPGEIGRSLGAMRDEGSSKGGPGDERSLDAVLDFLHEAKGVDFSFYKRSTLRRRVQRRMAMARVREPERYLRALTAEPREADLLFSDILISVTSFFREPESFQALKKKIYPRLLDKRPAGAPIRVWVPGCSTGEEAYSHAMNLVEHLGDRALKIPIQIFGTDVNPAVIAKARAGRFTKKMTAGVSAERLKRFFVEAGDGYRISPAIREMCVFAAHNLVQDPPFTNLSMISCRNLLIYMGPALQDKALQIFQYALNPRGILMLGRSESIGDFSGRFLSLNTDKKVFSERTPIMKKPIAFVQPGRFLEAESSRPAGRPGARQGKAAADSFDLQGSLDSVMPARYVPNGVVVNAELEILRFLGNVAAYLRPTPGKSGLNLRRMSSGEFLLELRAAILLSKKSAAAVRKEVAAPHPSGGPGRVRLEILPIKRSDPQNEYFLVLFEEVSAAAADARDNRRAPEARRRLDSRNLIELKEDLAVSGEHLKAIIEEQESTNAKLKSSNEELLSSNEELQSINEEFETTKEELQSSNEELISSTEEVGRGNQVLSRANNDLSNLLANIDIPVVLLDPDLAIHRFTPAAEKVLGLSADTIGRSIADLALPLALPDLKELLLGVIKTGRVLTREVQAAGGRWHYLILRPYRTDKSRTERSRTEGAVLALVDIHERKLAEKAVQRLAAVVRDSNDAVIVRDLKDRITAWNKGAQSMYGYTEAEGLRMSVRRLVPGHRPTRTRHLLRLAARGETPSSYEAKRRTKSGRILDVLITVAVQRDEKGRPVEIATTERDITAQLRAERERKASEKTVLRLANSVLDSNDAIIICDLKDRIIAWNKGAQRMYGYTEAEALGMSIKRFMPQNKIIRARELVRVSAGPVETQRRTKDGRILDVQLTVTVLRDDKGEAIEVATTERDITEQKRAERERKLAGKNLLRLANSVLDSNDAIIICDLKDRIIAWNKGAHRMYGYSEAEALGMSIRRLMPQNKLLRTRELVQVSAAPIETQRRTKHGRILDVLLTVTVLRDEAGRPVEVATTERDISAQKRADREFRVLHARVISAQETERQRLARELHDGVGQILSGVKYRLQALPGQMTLSEGAEAKILKVGGFLDHAIAEIRRVSQNLMPAELVDLGLEPALLTLCREFKERSGVQVTARIIPAVVPPDLGLAFYRIAQEALNNIGKHSKATMAVLSLSREGKDLVLSVSDNGAGFNPARRSSSGRGLGLGNMRQRAESVGGSLEFHSTLGAGTKLNVRAPLAGQGDMS